MLPSKVPLPHLTSPSEWAFDFSYSARSRWTYHCTCARVRVSRCGLSIAWPVWTKSRLISVPSASCPEWYHRPSLRRHHSSMASAVACPDVERASLRMVADVKNARAGSDLSSAQRSASTRAPVVNALWLPVHSRVQCIDPADPRELWRCTKHGSTTRAERAGVCFLVRVIGEFEVPEVRCMSHSICDIRFPNGLSREAMT